MNLAECLRPLWRLAECNLARLGSPPTDTVGRTVAYRGGDASQPQSHYEGGKYDWNDGCPIIRLLRDRVPAIDTEPDLATQPERDACLLAHEYGHFLSDRDGSRTQALYDKLGTGAMLDRAEQGAILAEEERAWDLGRKTVIDLGCDDLAVFDECRDRLLKTYRDGFDRMNATSTL